MSRTAPADDGGEGKAAQCHRRKDGCPAAVGRGKAGDRQLRARSGAVVDRRAAAQNDHSRQRADDDGVRKDLKDAEHALLDRLFRVGTGVGDGTSAKAGLVGEDAAGDALLHTDEQAADGAAREGRRVERTCKDGLDHRREALNVQNNDAHSQHDVEQCHEGTSRSLTLPMRLMPPSSTMATSIATTMPTTRFRVESAF